MGESLKISHQCQNYVRFQSSEVIIPNNVYFRSENPPGIVSRGGLVGGLGRDDLARLLRGPRWCQTDPRGSGLFRCCESKTFLGEYCRSEV